MYKKIEDVIERTIVLQEYKLEYFIIVPPKRSYWWSSENIDPTSYLPIIALVYECKYQLDAHNWMYEFVGAEVR